MKRIYYLTTLYVFVFSLFTTACKDDEENVKDTQPPVIEFANQELEGLPGETVNLTAKITDDAGIDYIQIESLDWEFTEKIKFSKQNYIREYDLSYSVIIPDQAPRGSVGKVMVKIFDHAGKSTQQTLDVSVTPEPVKLEIAQEMGFNIVLAGRKAIVSGNDVTFENVQNVTLPVKLTLNSNRTKLQTLTAQCPSLGIDETIDLTQISTDNGLKAVVDMNYNVHVGDQERNEVIFTLTDELGNTATYNPIVSVKPTFAEHNQKHTALFTLDKAINLDKVVFGLPMLAERKASATYKFTARYYASKANTEIVFVSSRKRNDQIKYGISNDKQYIIQSANPNPIVLPAVGHYEVTMDLLLGTYEVKALGKQDSKFEEMYFVYHGWSDYPTMAQSDAAHAPAIWSLDYSLTSGGGSDAGFGKGGGVWIVAGGLESSDPEVWLLKEDKPLYPQYNNFFDTSIPVNQYGECRIVFDNFLMKAYAIQK